ncbi:MAG: hypothetical protein HY865_22670 [Chloroflexi bacterium]|nr:hypothetical protein [Chloroflexota bacterium]
MNTQITRDAQKAVQVGFENHWRFRVVSESDYKDQWITERVTEAPVMVQDRVLALKRSGIRIKEFVIAHEAPRLLSAPKVFKTTTPDILPATKTILETLVKGFIFFLTIVLQAAVLDPAVIVVLEDGTEIEVMKWYE